MADDDKVSAGTSVAPDMIDELDRPAKPCSKRCPDGGWCLLPDKHETNDGTTCSGIPMRYGPTPPIDRKVMRRETYDPDWDPVAKKKRSL